MSQDKEHYNLTGESPVMEGKAGTPYSEFYAAKGNNSSKA
ncbi:Uncharacterised protein [Orientia tsutsugamushi]|uniref:Uncharacterized protein n=1 Tax=Orientia tsutsugamushi TaxID=784 RepID=A0A2U3R4Y3_ORITS|nr:hypothetical protein OTSTA763_2913 [Orientia tsutsugamushi str. TA763]KJV74287.1 hypothetical protein OTSTA763_1169 [Orientia tsutsugamushi str. TA763]SPP24807.1 Uncharacterised protein [Orientia tsutsugamushi]SPR08285.1 Uncharacterised protein [Orientia tsutsugamushi]